MLCNDRILFTTNRKSTQIVHKRTIIGDKSPPQRERELVRMELFTGAQVRMARAYLKWSIAELAEKSGVGISTIQRIEGEDGFPAARGGNIDAVYKALSAAGITFLPETDEGVGVRGRTKTRRAAK